MKRLISSVMPVKSPWLSKASCMPSSCRGSLSSWPQRISREGICRLTPEGVRASNHS